MMNISSLSLFIVVLDELFNINWFVRDDDNDVRYSLSNST